MRDFVEEAEDGVIVFSLGSFLSVTSIPRTIQEGISAAFKKLPGYRFAFSVALNYSTRKCSSIICVSEWWPNFRRTSAPTSGCPKMSCAATPFPNLHSWICPKQGEHIIRSKHCVAQTLLSPNKLFTM